jgi:ribonuclease BN (tRNA processing enzyme)
MNVNVTLLGTGVGIPQPGRSQAAILVGKEKPILLDCGAGTLLRLTDARVRMHDIDAVILTHLHLDHAADLLALANARYLMELPVLVVYGPEGTDQYFRTMKGAYPNLERMEVSVQELKGGDTLSLKGFEVTAAKAKHSLPALGYRIESLNRVVAYSGDTEPVQEIADMAKGADLLIHECSFPEPFEVTNHTTPKRLGNTIRGVKRIVLTHLYPEAQGHEKEMIADVRTGAHVPVEIGYDMQEIKL